MKKLAVILATLLMAGCSTTYTSTQVGPDRYIHTARGKDVNGNSYTRILQQAYMDCKAGEYKDYTVSRVMYDRDSMIVHVRCEKETQTSSNPEARTDGSNAAIDDAKRLYEALKRKIEEQTK